MQEGQIALSIPCRREYQGARERGKAPKLVEWGGVILIPEHVAGLCGFRVVWLRQDGGREAEVGSNCSALGPVGNQPYFPSMSSTPSTPRKRLVPRVILWEGEGWHSPKCCLHSTTPPLMLPR